jgi:16S rRNA (cytidine1402-2'-O)-methyltransferase
VLYLVSTPIGNLADFSYRAVEILKKCDYILCEDTRHSRGLLDHYGILAPLHSFHKFNEARTEQGVVEDLKAGKMIALISDAGTPLISDPGQKTALSQILLYTGTSVAYESPHRIEETLVLFLQLSPSRKLCVARELTKLYEECLSGTAEELLAHFKKNPPRGEMVLLISPPEEQIFYEHLSLQELVEMLQKDLHLSKGEAIKIAAQMRHLPKRKVYNHFTND